MKVTAFLGSPRKDGNTEILLKEAIKGIEESGFSVNIFNLN
jgi:multimeric flavodoxin WrbA